MTESARHSRLSKKTNRKTNFKAFVDSGYTNLAAFKKACKDDEDLIIYTCLKEEELLEIIEKIKQFDTFEEQIEYLTNNQPTMNATLERYNACVESIATYLKGYIEFNGRKMANAEGDMDDWASEFWTKFFKICEFYRVRWFFPETLTKSTTVTYNPTLYREFVYICRFAITGERKHLGFLATQNQQSSLFKASIDENIDNAEEGKSLADIIADPVNNPDVTLGEINVNRMIDKALELALQYEESAECYDKIKKLYYEQDIEGFDKKVILLSKIFLYKAGLVSPKVIQFIKNLSPTYKAKYNISDSRLKRQCEELKDQRKFKVVKRSAEDVSWHDIILDNNSNDL